MKLINTVLLEGDSWGCGAWASVNPTEEILQGRTKTVYGVYHKGFEQYFLEDHKSYIRNISKPGKSLFNYFDQINFEDIAIVYVTDPLRNLREREVNKIKSYSKILNYMQKTLEYELLRWSYLDIPIFLIGGCCKVTEEMVKDYSNIEVIIPSALEFLVPGKTQPDIWISSEWIENLNEDINSADLKIIVDQAEAQKAFAHTDESQLLFYPDGGHPNHLGYRKIYDYVMEYFRKRGYHFNVGKTTI